MCVQDRMQTAEGWKMRVEKRGAWEPVGPFSVIHVSFLTALDKHRWNRSVRWSDWLYAKYITYTQQPTVQCLIKCHLTMFNPIPSGQARVLMCISPIWGLGWEALMWGLLCLAHLSEICTPRVGSLLHHLSCSSSKCQMVGVSSWLKLCFFFFFF